MAISLTIGNCHELSANMAVYNTYESEFVFASAFGYSTAIEDSRKALNKKNTIRLNRRYYNTAPNTYEIITSKIPKTDFSHMIVCKKSNIVKDKRGNETIYVYSIIDEKTSNTLENIFFTAYECITDYPDILKDDIYERLYKFSPTPILKDWMNYLINCFVRTGRIRNLDTYSQDNIKHHIFAYSLSVEVSYLTEIISSGLRNNDIFLGDIPQASDKMLHLSGIDAYLNNYSDILANKIKDAFIPRFIPGKDKYSEFLNMYADYAEYHGHMELFEAQKAVIQSTSNALDHKNSAFIIGEMGCGKTPMSIMTVLTNAKNKRGLTNIVMCPPHLVNKWKSEIDRIAPLSESIIIENFTDLLNVESKVKDIKRKKNLWLVMSKETAKFGYEERPAAIWRRYRNPYSNAKGRFYCPECGTPLHYKKKVKIDKEVIERIFYFHETDFNKPNAINQRCHSKIRKWNKKEKEYKEVECNAKLWTAYNKDTEYKNGNNADEWIKTKAGWILKRHMNYVLDSLLEKESLTKEENNWISALTLALDEDEKQIIRAPRKYPISKYIKKYFKGCIDYVIFDEVHQLKAEDSAQAKAFDDLLKATKKSLGLTGTLLNGYASSIYYILFRMFSKDMMNEGFNYEDCNDFSSQYGVTKSETVFEFKNGKIGNRKSSSKKKALPGVSPIVFTKFLLENAAFISQEDIASGLPGYKEIPVGVEMDPLLNDYYQILEETVHPKNDEDNRDNDRIHIPQRCIPQILQLLSIYPDQPYDLAPVIDPETGNILITPTDLDKTFTRNKETELLRIVKDKIEKDEKVLIYYHWTNKTGLGNRLKKLIEAENIKVSVLTASITAKDRDMWIKNAVKNGTQVLICNPTLVETGLDLLDFTTIIFYQLGYNLFTMRQASRRSWRISQTKDVEVYFMYYKNTVQENVLSLMATKLSAATAIEGKFSEEGLSAMSNNEDILTQIAASITDGIKDTVDITVFDKTAVVNNNNAIKEYVPTLSEMKRETPIYDFTDAYMNSKMKNKHLMPVSNGVTNNISDLFEVALYVG